MFKKSRTKSFLLTFFFGPLGLFYSSTVAAIIMTVLTIVLIPTVVGAIVCWVLSIAIGDHSTHKHNKRVTAFLSSVRG